MQFEEYVIHKKAFEFWKAHKFKKKTSLIILSELFYKHGWTTDDWDVYFFDTATFICRKVEAYQLDQLRRADKRYAYKDEKAWMMAICHAARHVCDRPVNPRSQHWTRSFKEIDQWEYWATNDVLACSIT